MNVRIRFVVESSKLFYLHWLTLESGECRAQWAESGVGGRRVCVFTSSLSCRSSLFLDGKNDLLAASFERRNILPHPRTQSVTDNPGYSVFCLTVVQM